jgi:Transcription factor S-II (TFIIS)
MEARRLHNRYALDLRSLIHWLNLVKATCPKCDNARAYFYQLQIRSADEPMTTCESLFYFLNIVSVVLTFHYHFRLQSIGQWNNVGSSY